MGLDSRQFDENTVFFSFVRNKNGFFFLSCFFTYQTIKWPNCNMMQLVEIDSEVANFFQVPEYCDKLNGFEEMIHEKDRVTKIRMLLQDWFKPILINFGLFSWVIYYLPVGFLSRFSEPKCYDDDFRPFRLLTLRIAEKWKKSVKLPFRLYYIADQYYRNLADVLDED